jgi:hypothetical protein
MNREAGPVMNSENPTPGSHFCGLSTHEAQMTFPYFGAFESRPISAHYRIRKTPYERGGFYV